MRKICALVLFALVLGVVVGPAAAQSVPGVISYQGRLTDGSGVPVSGMSVPMTFRLWNGGTQVWTEAQVVAVYGGLYQVYLGAVTPLPENIFAAGSLSLEVTINGETLSPRMPLTSTAYAMGAALLGGHPASDFAGATHGHDFSALTGAVSDGQVPDTISILYAAEAGMLDGFYATDFAISGHTHAFSSLSGMVTDGQVPDNITIQNSDLLDNQHASYFRDAGNINAGTLGTGYYSCYSDLSAEGYLDNSATGDLMTQAQADGRFVNQWETWNSALSVTGDLTVSGGNVGIGQAPDSAIAIDNYSSSPAPTYGGRLRGLTAASYFLNSNNTTTLMVGMANMGQQTNVGTDTTTGTVTGAEINATGSNTIYGAKLVTNSYAPTGYFTYGVHSNVILRPGAAAQSYAGYFIVSGGDGGNRYGIYANSSSDVAGTAYGTYSTSSSAVGTAYGTHSSASMDSTNQSIGYGGYFTVTGGDQGNRYGLYSTAYAGDTTANAYGVYAYANNSRGDAYGIYASTNTGTKYAGYFVTGKVRIGTSGTEGFIDGSGDLYVADETEANEYYYHTARARYYSISLISYPGNSIYNEWYPYTSSLVCMAPAACSGHFPVNLPSGAIVTGINVYGSTSSTVHLFTCTLLSNLNTGGSSTTMATVSSTGTGMTLSDLTIFSPLIDNENNNYKLTCQETDTYRTNQVSIYGLRISYTMNGPD